MIKSKIFVSIIGMTTLLLVGCQAQTKSVKSTAKAKTELVPPRLKNGLKMPTKKTFDAYQTKLTKQYSKNNKNTNDDIDSYQKVQTALKTHFGADGYQLHQDGLLWQPKASHAIKNYLISKELARVENAYSGLDLYRDKGQGLVRDSSVTMTSASREDYVYLSDKPYWIKYHKNAYLGYVTINVTAQKSDYGMHYAKISFLEYSPEQRIYHQMKTNPPVIKLGKGVYQPKNYQRDWVGALLTVQLNNDFAGHVKLTDKTTILPYAISPAVMEWDLTDQQYETYQNVESLPVTVNGHKMTLKRQTPAQIQVFDGRDDTQFLVKITHDYQINLQDPR